MTSAIVAPSSVLTSRGAGTGGNAGLRHLGREGPAGELVEQHGHGAIGGAGVGDDVARHAAGEVARAPPVRPIASPRASFSPSPTSRCTSASIRVGFRAGLDDVDLAAIELDAGILRVHAGDGRYLQLGLDRGAERAARHAVAAGQERGPGHEEIGPRRGHEAHQLGGRALGLLGRVVVAADHRRDDRARVAERLLDGSRGADRPVHDLGPDAGLLLAAELAEELVEVADDSQRLGRHHRTSAITLVVPTCSIAPQSPP